MQLFLLAVLLGFTSSMPVGPINLFLADSVLNREKVRKFVIGVVMADVMILLAVSLFGMQSPFDGLWGVILWMLSSFVVLLLAGGMLIAPKFPDRLNPGFQFLNARARDNLWLGFLLCVGNPGFWLFWFSASNLLVNSLEVKLTGLVCAVMSFGVALGDLTWFLLLTKTLKHSLVRFGEKIIALLRVLAASLLLILATISLAQSLFKLFSNHVM